MSIFLEKNYFSNNLNELVYLKIWKKLLGLPKLLGLTRPMQLTHLAFAFENILIFN